MVEDSDEKRTFQVLAQATKAIAEENSRGAIAQSLLGAALNLTGALRGVIILHEPVGGSPTGFDVVLTHPEGAAFRLPEDLLRRVLADDEVVLEREGRRASAFGPEDFESDVAFLCAPLGRVSPAIGLIYLETTSEVSSFTADGIAAATLLVAQATLVLETTHLAGALEAETRQRRAAEEELRATHNALLKHQQAGRMGDFRFNTRTQDAFGSVECYKLFGFDPNLPAIDFRTWTSKIVEEDRQAIINELSDCVARRAPLKFEYRIELGGEVRNISCVGQVDSEHQGDLIYYGVVMDVTERKATEEVFRQVQLELDKAHRLASLGELAGSIIHEVNQPLSAINTSAEACLRWLGREPSVPVEARASLQRVIEEAQRAALVVGGLKSLAGSSELRLETVDVNALLGEVLALVKPDLDRARIALKVNLDPTIPRFRGDRVKLQQVVLNLIRNAIDALADVRGRGASLTVVSTHSETGEVLVAVSDNGDGLEAADTGRLFDALYTTKGQGMGLGLAISRKIIAAHGGRIWVNHNEPHGATFAFALPMRPEQGLAAA